MGEVMISICVGGFLVLSGIIMNVVLWREEKHMKLKAEEDRAS